MQMLIESAWHLRMGLLRPGARHLQGAVGLRAWGNTGWLWLQMLVESAWHLR